MAPNLPTALLPELLAYLQQAWPDLFPGQRRPRSLSYTLQGTGVGKLIVFVLAAGERSPRCIMKIPRSRRENDSLAHEYWMISELRRRRGPDGEAELPTPLAAPLVQGWQVVIEKMLPGKLLSSDVPVGDRLPLEQAAQHLRLVRDWLVNWQRAAHPAPSVLTTDDVQALLLAPIQSMQHDFDLRPHEILFLDHLGQRAETLVGRRVPLGFVHGDLRPGNILRVGQRLCVLDWQFGEMRALPLLDWFEFGYRYYCDAAGLEEITGEHDAYRATFADVFLGAHPYAALLADETQAIADALHVPADLLDLLLAMWLVNNSNKYLRFLSDRAEHGFLYLMQNPPGGPSRGFRQQLRRQVYPTLLGRLAESRGLGHGSHNLDGLRPLRFSVS